MKERDTGKPAQVNIGQRAFREAIRGTLHFPLLKNETVNAVAYGLPRLKHEFLDQGRGVIVVGMHFCQADPIWSINDTTEEREYRGVPMSGPIAKHQTLPGLVKLTRLAGVNLTPVVTRETMKKADAKGNPKGLKQGEGLRDYIEQSVDTIKKGGIVFVSPNATREPRLKKDEDEVVTGLIKGLALKRVQDFGIHFAAFEIEGVQDYSKKKGYNLFQKYRVIHGNTYSIEEFMMMAAGEIKDGETRREVKKRAMGNVKNIVFNEIGRIAPSAYLLRT